MRSWYTQPASSVLQIDHRIDGGIGLRMQHSICSFSGRVEGDVLHTAWGVLARAFEDAEPAHAAVEHFSSTQTAS